MLQPWGPKDVFSNQKPQLASSLSNTLACHECVRHFRFNLVFEHSSTSDLPPMSLMFLHHLFGLWSRISLVHWSHDFVMPNMHLVRRRALLFILFIVISCVCADPITAITATNGGQIILCAYRGDSNITCTQIRGPPPISTSFSSASSTKAIIQNVATTTKPVTSLDFYSSLSRTTNSTNTPVTVYLNYTSLPISNNTTSNSTVLRYSSTALTCNNATSSNTTRLSTGWTPATASLNNTSSSGAPYLNATSSTSPAASTTVKSIAPIPTLPGPYGPGNWSTLTCSPELTGNTGLSNDEVWAAADADGAWKYISTLKYDGSINWSSFVARALNLSSWQEYQCHELSVNNVCMYQQQCGAPITPAAWMIINSIANLWGASTLLN